MYKLGRGSREKVQQFMTITGASEKVALQALKASDWHLEGAFDFFYSQPQISVANSRHLEALYNKYKEPNADMIMVEGVSQLCNDLQLSNYDEEGAWPYLVDEFVEYLTENGLVQCKK